jgi:hypothetical protein
MGQLDRHPLPQHWIVRAFSSANHSIGIPQAETALQSWRNSMEARDPDRVDSLYHENGVLLGTLARQILRDSEGRKSYFRNLFEGKTDVKIDFIGTASVQLYSDTTQVEGDYTFTLTDEDGSQQIIPARYDFTYWRDEKGEIKITLHHSSKYSDPQPEAELQASEAAIIDPLFANRAFTVK